MWYNTAIRPRSLPVSSRPERGYFLPENPDSPAVLTKSGETARPRALAENVKFDGVFLAGVKKMGKWGDFGRKCGIIRPFVPAPFRFRAGRSGVIFLPENPDSPDEVP